MKNVVALLGLICFVGCSAQPEFRVEPQVLTSRPKQASFHPDDPTLCLIVSEGEVSVWRLTDPSDPLRISTLPASWTAKFVPGEQERIVSSGKDGQMRLWDLSGQPSSDPFENPVIMQEKYEDQSKQSWWINHNSVTGLNVSPNGTHLVASTYGGKSFLWQLKSEPKLLREIDFSLFFAPDEPATLVRHSQLDGHAFRYTREDGSGWCEPLKGLEQECNLSFITTQEGKPRIVASEKYGRLLVWERNGNLISDSISPSQSEYSSKPFVKRLAFSKADGTVITVGENTGTQMWTSDGVHLGSLETAKGYYVDDVEFNADGSLIAFVEAGEYYGDTSTVRFWQPSGKLLKTAVPCKGLRYDFDGEVSAMVAISDHMVVTGGRDGTIRITDRSKKTTIHSWPAHSRVAALGYIRETETIVSVGKEPSVRFWNQEGQETREAIQLPGHPEHVAFSNDFQMLAMSFYGEDADRELVTVDLGSGMTTAKFDTVDHGRPASGYTSRPMTQLATALCFASDAKSLYAGLQNGVVREFQTSDGRLEQEHNLHPETQFGRGAVCDLKIDASGTQLASVGDDGRIVIFDLRGAGGLVSSFHSDVPKRYPRQIRQVAWTHDGNRVATLAVDGTLVIWSKDLTTKSKPIQLDGAFPKCLELNGTLAISAGLLGHIRATNLEDLEGVVTTLNAGHGELTDKGASSLVGNGKDLLYTAGLNGKVSAWATSGDLVAESIDGHCVDGHLSLSLEQEDWTFEKITGMDVARDSGTVVTCGNDGRILTHSRDLKSSKQVVRLEDIPSHILVSTDGSHVFVATKTGELRKYSTANGTLVWRKQVGDHVSSLHLNEAGQRIVVCLGGEGICFVEAEAGRVTDSPQTSQQPIALSASNNRQYLLATYPDGKLGFKNGAEVAWQMWPEKVANIESTAISDDGKRIAVLRLATDDWRGNSVVEFFTNRGITLGQVVLPSNCDDLCFVDGRTIVAAVGDKSLHFAAASANELTSLTPAYQERAILDVNNTAGFVAHATGKLVTMFNCNGEMLWTQEFRQKVRQVEILRKPESILVHCGSELWIADCKTGDATKIARDIGAGKPLSFFFDTDIGLLAVGCDDGTVEIFAITDIGISFSHRLKVFEVGDTADDAPRGDWPYEEAPTMSAIDDGSLPPKHILFNDSSLDENQPGSVVAVAIHQEQLYAMSASGATYCLNRGDGKTLHEPFQLPYEWDLDKSSNDTSLTPVGDFLLVEDDDEQLILDKQMNRIWSYEPRFVFNTVAEDVVDRHFWCVDGGSVRLLSVNAKEVVSEVRSRKFEIPMTLVSSSTDSVTVSPQFDAPASDSPSTVLHFLDRDLRDKGKMIVGNLGVFVITPDGHFAGSGQLFDSARVFQIGSIEPLQKAEGIRLATSGKLHEELNSNATTATRVIEYCDAQLDRVVEAYSTSPVVVKAAIWPTLAYSLTIMAVLGIWIIAPARLAEMAMSRVGAERQTSLQKLSRFFTLIYFLGHSRRAVDAWLGKRFLTLVERCLTDCSAYQDRRRYVDLGYEGQSEEWFRRLANGKSGGVWIYGPGGHGKSTMAFEIARRVNSARRMPLLTFLISEDWTGNLVDLMCDRLHTDDKRPTRSMVEGLLHRKRIIVILDGASERRVVSEKGVLAGTAASESEALSQVRALMEKGILRCLIATSRHLPPKKRVFERFCFVELGPISESKLESFVREYVGEDEFDDVHAAVTALALTIPLSPLMARMAIEVAPRSEAITPSFTQLAVDYVLALRSQSSDTLCEQDFIRVVKEVAHLCVEDEATSSEVCFYELRGYLKGKAEASPYTTIGMGDDSLPISDVIDELVKSGLIEMNRNRDRIRFCADPIAEYMAAWAICDTPSELNRFRSKIRMLQKNRGDDFATGLSRALDDVEAARRLEVPEEV